MKSYLADLIPVLDYRDKQIKALKEKIWIMGVCDLFRNAQATQLPSRMLLQPEKCLFLFQLFLV